MAVETPDSLTSFISSVVLPSTAPNDIRGLVSKIEKKCAPELFSRVRFTIEDFLRELHIALIVVDFQNDFVNGSLSILNGPAQQDPQAVIPPLNKLISLDGFKMVVYTMDWHPPNHISFYDHAKDSDRVLSAQDQKRHLKAFDVVRFESPHTEQVLYPSHCVKNTWGAALHDDVKIVENAFFVEKGTDVLVDSYSGFANNDGLKKSKLESMLRSERINCVITCGLAYDICVMYTARDAAKLGFLTTVIKDCSSGLSDEKIEEANQIFAENNIAVNTESEAELIMTSKKIPLEWISAVISQKLGIK
ncbi:hypothetical protein WR25_22538 isoform A [Diploscapter pachys]|uniref:nicotinamidase n=1 Tax=Diploscapter pachys TaxID=2018661 RepID=A0A2A2JXT2_9BILA|nr:hypothetical protein WR25_22538 isoform A [Diploscapter pachys]